MNLSGSGVAICRAGGSARAPAFALAHAGAQVFVCARRPEAARKLAKASRGEANPRAALRTLEFDALLNATPIVMFPPEKASPLPARQSNCSLLLLLLY